ncbi:hypothetical protein ABPG72_020123 [Tetrahymena utriculariae]
MNNTSIFDLIIFVTTIFEYQTRVITKILQCLDLEQRSSKYYQKRNKTKTESVTMVLKQMSKEEALRQRVYKFYQNHKEKGKVYTVKHFMDEGEKRSTIYDIISREQSGLGAQRVIGSGRIAKKIYKNYLTIKTIFHRGKPQTNFNVINPTFRRF